MSQYKELFDMTEKYINEGNWETAYHLVKEGDQKNDCNATGILGLFYLFGLGIPKDIEMGMKLLEKAIFAGCTDMVDKLGTLYITGDIVPKDEHRAFSIFLYGAEKGNTLAMGKVSSMYLDGMGTPADEQKAMEWGQKAAESGNIVGIQTLISIYLKESSVYYDPKMAVYWIREDLKIEPENTFFMYSLAACLSNPWGIYSNLIPDEAMLREAYMLARKGAELGDMDCHVLLCWFYETGHFVKKDLKKAYEYLKIAADHGHEIAAKYLKQYRIIVIW